LNNACFDIIVSACHLDFNGHLYKTGEQIMVSLCPISVTAACIKVLKKSAARFNADETARPRSLAILLQLPASYKS
jgi:hypothetical protein